MSGGVNSGVVGATIHKDCVSEGCVLMWALSSSMVPPCLIISSIRSFQWIGGLPVGAFPRAGDGDGCRAAAPEFDGDTAGGAGVLGSAGDWSSVCAGVFVGAEPVTVVVEVVISGAACGSWRTVEEMMVGAGPPGEPRLVGGGSTLVDVAGEVDWRGGVGVGLAVRGLGGRSWEAAGSCIAIA